ncbi:MAG TPA: hypothetical protein VID28_14965 [Methylomirabilota bacterium]|jgi:hypothetical protein
MSRAPTLERDPAPVASPASREVECLVTRSCVSAALKVDLSHS